MKATTNNAEETQALAAGIIKMILEFPFKKAKVIGLEGELGAGKTTLIQAIAKELGVKDSVKSPTFVIMKKYTIQDSRFINQNLYHLDCYRLRDENDLNFISAEHIFDDPRNIIFIEWAERVRNILPEKHITIHIDHIDQDKRRIEIK